MTVKSNPSWWRQDYDSAWDRVKAAVQRDWDQTKHDFGGKQPDTKQNATDTVAQAAGSDPIPPRGDVPYDEAEPAYRFGYAARMEYGDEYDQWNDDVETRLKEDWEEMEPADPNGWNRQSSLVRAGWDYRNKEKP